MAGTWAPEYRYDTEPMEAERRAIARRRLLDIENDRRARQAAARRRETGEPPLLDLTT